MTMGRNAFDADADADADAGASTDGFARSRDSSSRRCWSGWTVRRRAVCPTVSWRRG